MLWYVCYGEFPIEERVGIQLGLAAASNVPLRCVPCSLETSSHPFITTTAFTLLSDTYPHQFCCFVQLNLCVAPPGLCGHTITVAFSFEFDQVQLPEVLPISV